MNGASLSWAYTKALSVGKAYVSNKEEWYLLKLNFCIYRMLRGYHISTSVIPRITQFLHGY